MWLYKLKNKCKTKYVGRAKHVMKLFTFIFDIRPTSVCVLKHVPRKDKNVLYIK